MIEGEREEGGRREEERREKECKHMTKRERKGRVGGHHTHRESTMLLLSRIAWIET